MYELGYPKIILSICTVIKYSAALFGLLNAAFIAATHSSLGYPIEINSSRALSYSGPETKSVA